MDMEGDLRVDLVLGRPFLRFAKARIDVEKREINFRVGREDMFFRFKKKEEQRCKDRWTKRGVNWSFFQISKTR